MKTYIWSRNIIDKRRILFCFFVFREILTIFCEIILFSTIHFYIRISKSISIREVIN